MTACFGIQRNAFGVIDVYIVQCDVSTEVAQKHTGDRIFDLQVFEQQLFVPDGQGLIVTQPAITAQLSAKEAGGPDAHGECQVIFTVTDLKPSQNGYRHVFEKVGCDLAYPFIVPTILETAKNNT